VLISLPCISLMQRYLWFSALLFAWLLLIKVAEASDAESDPYLWLEDAHGARALAWVEGENAKTLAVLEKDQRFTELYDEALAIALAFGSVLSFVSMWMASQVGETAALRLHATELLMLLGTAIVLLVEPPVQVETDRSAAADHLSLQQPQLLDNR